MWHAEGVQDLDPRQLDIPTLILHGTADAIVPIQFSRELAVLLPNAELLEFEGSGHVPTMTRSNDVVDAIRRRFA
jgi:pimeloyl-ACP methyl ester carboxylesterase